MIRKLLLVVALIGAALAVSAPPASSNTNSAWDWGFVSWGGTTCIYKGQHLYNLFGYPIAETQGLYGCGQSWVHLQYTWDWDTIWAVSSGQTTGNQIVNGGFGATPVNSKHKGCTPQVCDLAWWRH